MFDKACAAKDIEPDIVLQASAPDAVADLASRGLGIAVLTESMAARHVSRLKALVIEDVHDPAGLALIWTTTKSPALQAFLLHCYEAFSQSS
jgi:DNA-binding transcriptional LysR family regulator